MPIYVSLYARAPNLALRGAVVRRHLGLVHMTLADIANIATSIGIIVAVFGLAYQFFQFRQSSEFESFAVLLHEYRRIVDERRGRWNLIRAELQKNPKTAHEVHDRQNTLDYLALRSMQSEPFVPVEHELLEREVVSLNLLDELCRLAVKNERCRLLLVLTEASEISYYQSHKDQLLQIVERERRERKFPKPHFEAIGKICVHSWFDE